VLDRPNEWMTGMEFFEWLVGVATFREGAYALITRDEYGRVSELLPLLPGSVTRDHVPGSRWEIVYRINGYGETIIPGPGQLLKLRGPLHDDYLRGQSVSHVAREAIGLAAALEQSQARFHGDDMRPSGGILTSKVVGLDPKLREEIRQQWQARYRRGGEGGIAVMDGDWDFKAVSPTSADSQVIENRKFQIEEVCRFFRVFPQIIGHSQGAVGYNGHEQLLNAHGEHSLLPWVLRLEQALMRDLLSEEEYRDGYRIDIDQDAVKRGTLSDRVAAYDKAVKIYKTPNEIRAEEGLDPLDDDAMDRVQLQANNTGMAPRVEPQRQISAPADPSTAKHRATWRRWLTPTS
jgi:HK97 family phage portal protein